MILALTIWTFWLSGDETPVPRAADAAKAYAPADAPLETPSARQRASAPGAPFDALASTAASPGPASGMTEEERSARNEQLIGELEEEKKRMGIARVLPRRSRRRFPAARNAESSP